MRPVEESNLDMVPSFDLNSGGTPSLEYLLGGSGGYGSANQSPPYTAGSDLTTLLGGVTQLFGDGGNAGDGLGGILSSAFSGAATGLGFGGPLGAGIGAGVGVIANLFSGPATNEAQQSADINKIAAYQQVTPGQAAKVIAYHADHSSDHFNDLAAYVANENPARFDSLLSEYNAANSGSQIFKGAAQAAAQQAAQHQQQLIQTATTSPTFAASTQGQQLLASLNAAPSNQLVGTTGQTAGQAAAQILQGAAAGAIKGAQTAAAGTDMGQQMKKNYIIDWAKENQLIATGAAGVALAGLWSIFKALRGGKVSL